MEKYIKLSVSPGTPLELEVGDLIENPRNGLFAVVSEKLENKVKLIYINGPYVSWQEYSGWTDSDWLNIISYASDEVKIRT